MKHSGFIYICNMSENEEILYLLRDNNRMLKEIITYIAQVNMGADAENTSDFIHNVLANMISNNFNTR